jgi:chemotaxis protein MotB
VRVLGVLGWLIAIGLAVFGYGLYNQYYCPALEESGALRRENQMFLDLVSELRGIEPAPGGETTHRLDIEAATRQLEATLRDEIAQGGIEIELTGGRLSITLLDDLLFESGEATLADEGREILDRLGPIIAGMADHEISVEGHTDDVRIGPRLREKFATNWELSAARATHVVRYMQNELNIAPEKLAAVAYGAYRPTASNDTEGGRTKNRRIELLLIPPPAVAAGGG